MIWIWILLVVFLLIMSSILFFALGFMNHKMRSGLAFETWDLNHHASTGKVMTRFVKKHLTGFWYEKSRIKNELLVKEKGVFFGFPKTSLIVKEDYLKLDNNHLLLGKGHLKQLLKLDDDNLRKDLWDLKDKFSRVAFEKTRLQNEFETLQSENIELLDKLKKAGFTPQPMKSGNPPPHYKQ